jgi:predicted nucleotidyltransferase
VTYEGFYCDIASSGEKVKIRGKLERIKNERTGEIYHRLIGSKGIRLSET